MSLMPRSPTPPKRKKIRIDLSTMADHDLFVPIIAARELKIGLEELVMTAT